MIGATVAMVSMALLFVVFGLTAAGEKGQCEGGCAGCSGGCELNDNGSEA